MARVTWSQAAVLIVFVVGGGCATATTQTTPTNPATASASSQPSAPVVMPPMVINTKDNPAAAQAFEKAKADMMAGRYREASAGFDTAASLDAGGSFAPAALFNAGLCLEQLDDRKGALARYRDAAQRFPNAREAHTSLVRVLRILKYFESWAELISAADLLLAHKDLTPIERVEALGSRALGMVEQNQIDAAQEWIAKARNEIEDNRLDAEGALPIGTAATFFALGEVRRIRGERITFVPVPPNFAQTLEERCQAILDAQDAYLMAMRTYESHWAAMSAYRMGQLYQQLHKDLMAIAPPAAVKTERHKMLFEAAMRLRYRALVEKGITSMDRTLKIAERTGDNSAWVQRAKEAKVDLERALQQEKALLAKLPYTEADIQQTLDDLAKNPPKKTP